MAFYRAGFSAETSFTVFLLADYKSIERFGLFLAGMLGGNGVLGSRTAVLGQLLCKFLLADNSGVDDEKRV
jgi:hypothetical protein